MSSNEKRKRSRKNNLHHETAYIEVKHSFGTLKKSVYKVKEYDEYGLSFYIPHSDGYFLVGTPLKLDLIRDKAPRVNMTGSVRYYRPHYDEKGVKYYIIGLELMSSFRDNSEGLFQLRPERFMNSGNTQYIKFEIDNKQHEYSLIDVSKYSAAFLCDQKENLLFRISSILNSVEIYLDKVLIFKGSAIITKIYQDNQKQQRVIIEPRKKLINIDELKNYEYIENIDVKVKNINKKIESFEKIDFKFKALTTDLRLFLENYNNTLKAPEFLENKDDSLLLDKIFPMFHRIIDNYFYEINNLMANKKNDDEEYRLYKSYFQDHLLTMFLKAPANHRMYYKPIGYPGDYEMMRMLHINDYEGDDLLSKLLHRYTTSLKISNAVRVRTNYIKDSLKTFVEKSEKSTIKVFSIASGPSLEIDLLIREHPQIADKIKITLLDQEVEALKYAQSKLYENRIKNQSNIDIEFINNNIGSFLRKVNKSSDEKYDFIYAFGLFDYFDDKTAKFVIKNLLKKLNKKGKILISNCSKDNQHDQTILEFIFDWYLIYRDDVQMKVLGDYFKDKHFIKYDEIEKGIVKFIEISS